MNQLTRAWILAGALATGGFTAGQAEAASTLRCPSGIVNTGDSLYEVRSTCGAPDQIEEYVEYRTVRARVGSKCRTDASGDRVCTEIVEERTIEVPMHRLTYDFGKNRFIQYLTFERGRLIVIERGRYGHKPRVAG